MLDIDAWRVAKLKALRKTGPLNSPCRFSMIASQLRIDHRRGVH
jgi:hypothetical protein